MLAAGQWLEAGQGRHLRDVTVAFRAWYSCHARAVLLEEKAGPCGPGLLEKEVMVQRFLPALLLGSLYHSAWTWTHTQGLAGVYPLAILFLLVPWLGLSLDPLDPITVRSSTPSLPAIGRDLPCPGRSCFFWAKLPAPAPPVWLCATGEDSQPGWTALLCIQDLKPQLHVCAAWTSCHASLVNFCSHFN